MGLALVFLLELRFCVQTFARVGLRAVVNLVQCGRKIREHEGVRVLRAEKIPTLFSQVRVVALLVNRVKQLLLLLVKLGLLLVRVQLQLGLVH